jgi:hypothetical protein
MLFKKILLRAASDFGVDVAKVVRFSMPGLIEYHAAEQ